MLRKYFWIGLFLCVTVRAEVLNPTVFMQQQIANTQSEIKRIKNPSNTVYAKVLQRTLIPHINFAYAARLSLGKYWRQASAEQQQDFVKEFTRLLSFTYIGASRAFSKMRFEYIPDRYQKGEENAMVRVLLHGKGKKPLDIGYRLLLTDGAWSIYDIRLSTLWFTQNYKVAFGRLIARKGIDGLIEELARKAKKLETRFYQN